MRDERGWVNLKGEGVGEKKSVGKRSTEKGEAGGGIRKKGNEGRKKGDEIMEKERGRKM